MNSRDLIAILKQDGWFEVQQEGSHKQFRHATKRGRVTYPKRYPDRTLKGIAKQAGLNL